ncbi:putative sodium bile acid cotransporter [Globomyces pollinis-pini]|nr:putative sodium bile acid cotransporter [Globomyces pollinis-pini]
MAMNFVNTITAQVKKHWFLLGLVFAIILAAVFPYIGKKGGWIRSEYTVSYGAIILIFFISGLSLKSQALKDAVLYWQLIIVVQVISLGITPLIGYGVMKLLLWGSFDANLARGFVVACACPTTVSSNVLMTKTAGGNEAAALTNAVIGSILGVFLSPPLIVFMLDLKSDNGGSVDYISILFKLFITVILPLIVGQIIRVAFPNLITNLQKKLNLAIMNSTLLLILVWSVFCETFSEKDTFSNIPVLSFIVTAIISATLFCSFSLLAFYVSIIPACGFTRPDTIAIVMCGATKTVALGIPLINVIFNGNPALGIISIPLLVYHAEQLFIGSFMIPWFQNWVKDRKPLPAEENNDEGNAITLNETAAIAIVN